MRKGIEKRLTFPLKLLFIIPLIIILLVGTSIKDRFDLLKVILPGILLSLPIYASSVYLFYIVKKYVLKPVQDLNMAANQVMQGNYNSFVDYDQDDEIGALCKTFNAMQVQLKEAVDRRDELEKSRKEMIASISHDLRTPISSIKGYVEGLEDGVVHDEERFKRYLSVIKDKTNRLNSLIDQLFLYSQVDLKQNKDNLMVYDSGELLDDILSTYSLEFMEENIEFMVDRPFPNVKVRTDYEGLIHVFDNLISNAKRYANNEIQITSEVQEKFLEICLKDDGRGILVEDQAHIFDNFYRIEKFRASQLGGAGLGLPICRKIIEGQGGQIWVESLPNVNGTIFKFTIPLDLQKDKGIA
ncbi:MAG: HAMP domain-containing sensor histidine kinase [Miniphocaeibacter sp.]|nr:HAMP domain-containing histidine kinase [Gallicola sp.]